MRPKSYHCVSSNGHHPLGGDILRQFVPWIGVWDSLGISN